MRRTNDTLLSESHRINYRLRSTFFYHKLKEYGVLTFTPMIKGLFPFAHLYNWDERANWGIGEDAFAYIAEHENFQLIQVFCHPKLLREYPTLLAYYRNIAALSRKSVMYLSGISVAKYETNPKNAHSLDDVQALTLSRLFNEHMTLIVDSSIKSFTEQELQGLLLASTGTQIDGAWRNAIGEEAEKVVQGLLVKKAVERGLLQALIPRDGKVTVPYNAENLEEYLSNIRFYKGILFSNQTSMLFSSEPDIAILGKQGTTLGMIEIKGGTDPAGALERYGAAKKSFEKALRLNSHAKTILIASCITNEVHDRIVQDTMISHYFNLTEVLSSKEAYDNFMQLVFFLLHE